MPGRKLAVSYNNDTKNFTFNTNSPFRNTSSVVIDYTALSVGTKEISELLEANDFQIERSAGRLPEGSLKELGNYVIDIELHPEVIAKINLELKPEES